MAKQISLIEFLLRLAAAGNPAAERPGNQADNLADHLFLPGLEEASRAKSS
jgi:hypothetical protein